MNDLSEAVERLTRSVADLQSRVSALENPARTLPPLPAQPVLSAPAVYATAAEAPSFAGGAGIFPVLGKAMLGIAGAYLLRAVVQSAALPRAPVVAVAIAYAVLWLVPAARAPAKAWFASAAWAGSSALILIPMLWELTLRFRILPSAVTAGILSIWAIAASALVWKRHFAAVAGTVYTAASLAALVLAVATRDPAPFLFALLAIAFIGEAAAAGHRALRVRPVIAAAADLAVFALIWIYSSPAASHADYPAIAAPVLLAFAPALLLIYAASAAAQTLLLRRGISFFEIAQTLMAALLTVWTVLEFWPGHGPLVLGVLCLIASAAGYAVTFAWFDRLHAQRNYHVYATGSLALLLAGSFLCLPRGWLPLCLGLFAVGAVLFGVRTARDTLQFHGLALLAAAAYSSGLFAYIVRAMAGASPAVPGWMVCLACASAVLCYAAVARPASPRSGLDERWRRFLRFVLAGLAVAATTALLVWIAIWILARFRAAGVAPPAEQIAVIRTLVACAAALALAWRGSGWQRRELVWLAWATLAGIGLKLLFEDLRHGHLGFTAASIFLFAVTLLLVPRLLRVRSRAASDNPS
jgi:hypothetical protein